MLVLCTRGQDYEQDMIKSIELQSGRNKKTVIALVAAVCLAPLVGIRPDLALTVAGVIAGFVLFSQPTWAFALFMLAIVFNSFLPPFQLPVVDVALAWSNALGLVVFGAMMWKSRLRTESLLWNSSLTFMLLFVIWAAISVTWATDLRDALVRAIAWLFFLLFYVAFVSFLSKPSHQVTSMKWIAMAGWILLIIGFSSAAFFGVENRDFVLGINPNSFSARLVFCMIGIYWVAFIAPDGSQKENPQFLAPSLYLVLTLILITFLGSRGEFISVLAFLTLTTLLPGNRQRRFLIFVVLVLAAASLSFTTDIWQAMTNRFIMDDTMGGRTDLWELSWYLFRQNPTFGVGIGGAQHALSLALGIEEGKSPHNALVLVLLDTGIIGLSLYLMMILAPIIAFIRRLLQDISSAGMSSVPYRYWLLLAAFIAYLASWGKGGGSQHDLALYFFLALFFNFAREQPDTNRLRD